MQIEAYTPASICQCLGLVGFEVDPQLTEAQKAIRLLLMPSFHPEVCITIADGRVTVVAARWMIWRMFEPAPMLTDQDEAQIPNESFTQLLGALHSGQHSTQGSGIAIDGMPVAALLFEGGLPVLQIHQNVGSKSGFSATSAHVISEVWRSIKNAYCRNALAEAGKYAGIELPPTPEPQRKPTVETLILGPEHDRIQLMEALKKHHAG